MDNTHKAGWKPAQVGWKVFQDWQLTGGKYRRQSQCVTSSRERGSRFHFLSPSLAASKVFSVTWGQLMGVRRKPESVLWSPCHSDLVTSLQTSCQRTFLRVPSLGHRGYTSHLDKKFSLTPESGKRKRLRWVLSASEPMKNMTCLWFVLVALIQPVHWAWTIL